MNIIQQLQDLKEWSQNRSRYERRMNFRNGQLVQPGPGRLGFDKGGMANVLNYLNNLEPGTELTMNDIMKVARDNKWEVNVSTVYEAINNPNKKQIAKSGNEVFVHGTDKRNLLNKINQKIKLKQKFKQSPNEDLFKQIDLMIADKEKYPSMKSIGEELGYKPTKKGQGGNLRLDRPLMEEWQKSRRRNLILEMRFKEYKLTKDSPWVKKAIAVRKELGSTRATAQKLGVDSKTIRNIMEQFSPNEFGSVNEWKSNKWNYKKERAKTEKMLEKRLGGKNSTSFRQYMNLWDDIAEMNNEILNMTDDQIYNNPRMRASMNLDVTGLKSGDELRFDKYENLSKKDFAAKVRKMAKTNQFYQAEHSIPISSKKISAAYQKNLQVAQGKIGSQMEAIKTYIRNNPNGKHIPAINEFLEEFDIQVREGGNTYGWKNPKDNAGLNVYRSDTNTSDIVESAFNKNKQGIINNPKLKNIPDAEQITKLLQDAEVPCAKGVGGQCNSATDYRKGFNEVVQRSAAGDKKALTKLQKFTQGMKKIKGPLKWTWYGILGEIGFMVPFAVADYTTGESWKRIMGNATDLGFGPMFGQSEDEEIIANLPEGSLGAEYLEAVDSNQRLNALENPNRNFPKGRIGMNPQRFQKAQINVMQDAALDHRDNMTPFMEGPRNQFYNPNKADVAKQDVALTTQQIAEQKKQRIEERQERGFIAKEGWEKNVRRPWMGGGIVGIRRPNAIPPASGPDPQGLASMNNYATKRTE